MGPWRLALRLDRGPLLAWLAGTVVWGLLIGLLVTAAVRLVEDSPGLAELIRSLGGAGSIADSYVLLMGTLLALVASAYGITTVLRTHQDEVAGRAELLLSTRVARSAWFLSRVLTAGIGMVAILVLATAATGSAYALSSDGTRGVLAEAGRFAGAGLLSASAAAVVVAVAALIVGAWPRWTSLAWGALVWAGVVAWLGPLLDLPDAILRTSPFWYVPAWPVEAFEPLPVLALVAVAAGLVGLALVLLRRRNVPAG
jgi:ABC-2 type transport system permease protein